MQYGLRIESGIQNPESVFLCFFMSKFERIRNPHSNWCFFFFFGVRRSWILKYGVISNNFKKIQKKEVQCVTTRTFAQHRRVHFFHQNRILPDPWANFGNFFPVRFLNLLRVVGSGVVVHSVIHEWIQIKSIRIQIRFVVYRRIRNAVFYSVLWYSILSLTTRHIHIYL